MTRPDPALLRSMLLIRAFEASLMSRKDHGFQLLSSGQEAVSVGLCAALAPGDQLLCSGRSIGPALARGLDPGIVLAELLGKEAGYCSGRGGRGHMAAPAAGFFGAHAVVGGNLTIAAGVALRLQGEGHSGLAACMFGDGACGSGALHETLNIAAIWRLPLLLVCDNNQYSVSTPRSAALAPARLSDLAAPFGIPGVTVDGMDVLAVRDAAQALAATVRAGGGPAFLECQSYGFTTHSTSSRESRPRDEVALARERCPIRAYTEVLLASGAAGRADVDEMTREVDAAIAGASRFADESALPSPEDVLRHVD
jgi:TPP-dependent pyruvate/acetoin dehydrogenase alpha subunit